MSFPEKDSPEDPGFWAATKRDEVAAEPQPRVVRKENPAVAAIREADQRIKQGHTAMRAESFRQAVDHYSKALDHYIKARNHCPGKGYEYLEEKITHINGWLRDARWKADTLDMQRARGD